MIRVLKSSREVARTSTPPTAPVRPQRCEELLREHVEERSAREQLFNASNRTRHAPRYVVPGDEKENARRIGAERRRELESIRRLLAK